MKETTSIRLKKLMNDRDLKQVDIIKLCVPYCKKYNVKLSKNYLSQYVSGKVEPGQRTLSILGMALNVNEAWLMGFDVPMGREPLKNHKMLYNDNNPISEVHEASIPYCVNSLNSLLKHFNKLNSTGKDEAVKRVEELTHFEKYTEEIAEDIGMPIAAHNDHPLSDEEKDLMRQDLDDM